MKTFEEKWTAWLDDQLSGRELSEFEALLPDKAAAEAEKAEAKKLGELLKRELAAHPLKNEEFLVISSAQGSCRKVASNVGSALAEVGHPLGGRFPACCGRVQLRLLYF